MGTAESLGIHSFLKRPAVFVCKYIGKQDMFLAPHVAMSCLFIAVTICHYRFLYIDIAIRRGRCRSAPGRTEPGTLLRLLRSRARYRLGFWGLANVLGVLGRGGTQNFGWCFGWGMRKNCAHRGVAADEDALFTLGNAGYALWGLFLVLWGGYP